MTNYAYDDGRPTVGQAGAQQIGLEEQLSRLDKLEQVIAAERERLNRPSADSRDQPGRRSGDQYDPRSGDQQEPVDTLREVDVPGLETKVTESQREAWALGYHAGCPLRSPVAGQLPIRSTRTATTGAAATSRPVCGRCQRNACRGLTVPSSIWARRTRTVCRRRICELAPQMPIVVLTGLDDGAVGVTALRRATTW